MADDNLFGLDYADVIKAKYTRREGTPGNYRYFYDGPGRGPQQGGGKKQHEPHRVSAEPEHREHTEADLDAYSSGTTLISRPKKGRNRGKPIMARKRGEKWDIHWPDDRERDYENVAAGHTRGVDEGMHPRGVLFSEKYWRKYEPVKKAENMVDVNPLDLVNGNVHILELPDLVKAKEKTVSREISHLIRDKDYPQKRAVAAALEMERRGKISKAPQTDEGVDDDDEEEEDPAAAEAAEEEKKEQAKSVEGAPEEGEGEGADQAAAAKSDTNPLDLVKAEPSVPRFMRQGAVLYINPGAHEVKPTRSRESLRKAEEPEAIVISEPGDPIDLPRMPDGTLTHPNGKRRID